MLHEDHCVSFTFTCRKADLLSQRLDTQHTNSYATSWVEKRIYIHGVNQVGYCNDSYIIIRIHLI